MRRFCWLVFLLLLQVAWAQEDYLPAREGLSWTYANGQT